MNKTEPGVLHLIDSLETGGAERMSVNLSNALNQNGVRCVLVASRRGGALEGFLHQDVPYYILGKRSSIDPFALRKLLQIIKEHRIGIIHAHSSSWFTALQCRLFSPVKVVWHDHYGLAERLDRRPYRVLRAASGGFAAILSANTKLQAWAIRYLKVPPRRVLFLSNFAELPDSGTIPDLPGTKETRIVCLANLRPQKDHVTLLKAFAEVRRRYPQWHLLLVGKDRNDDYSRELKKLIAEDALEACVHLLGSREDTADILRNSSIGVLSSASEGLPVALLEYGLAGLPTVTTAVGEIPAVLSDERYGWLVPPADPEALAGALEEALVYSEEAAKKGKEFKRKIENDYGREKTLKRLRELYQRITA